MTMKNVISVTAIIALLGACSPSDAGEDEQGAKSAVEQAGEAAPPIGASDNLVRLTCADFLSTAQVAATQPADEAALAAQDELATGLTWLHGFLYAQSSGEIEPLSQNWMKATVERVYSQCNEASDPATVNLFEVAKS